MIDFYDPNFQGIHVIRVTFMQWNYVGHVSFRIGGNCKGAEVLDLFSLEFDISFIENDCRLCFDDDYNIYHVTLKNTDGDELEVEGDIEEIKDMIVSIEIVSTINE